MLPFCPYASRYIASHPEYLPLVPPAEREHFGLEPATNEKDTPLSAWTFEPGHTEAEFRARHMMVTWVRGMFKDIHGTMEFDYEHPLSTKFEGEIDVTRIWTGDDERDGHLRTADFFEPLADQRVEQPVWGVHAIEVVRDLPAQEACRDRLIGIAGHANNSALGVHADEQESGQSCGHAASAVRVEGMGE